ncbi:MAG: VOC family protein [Flavobacteriia bacterium]|nr:VOC family protein [Flavobacteriia bacterium]OJX39016.1 MAG: glyoxalase [Flavobacteriia bacterium 40-80]
MEKIICGIQQMGIGVPNVQEVWKWYRKAFGTDVKVFEEAAEAPLMTKYTGGKVQSRTATLALSMQGGGGFEIWQYTSRNTEKPAFEVQLGDYGLYACKIKSRDVQATYNYYKKLNFDLVSEIEKTPEGKDHFFVRDPNGNLFEIVEGLGFFSDTKFSGKTGGVAGTIIGVSNIENSLKLYQDVLEYDQIVYDVTEVFNAYKNIPGGNKAVRRVLLRHSKERKGPFAKLLGPTEIELIQAVERTDVRNIFENRFWGDWGFIHLCFDIQGMDALQSACEKAGFPFTVDSGKTFDMGEAGGRFSYIEDPDGTWIEFVETHKVPVMKKLGWYINLNGKKPGQSLPNWMLKAMKFNRVKD